MPKRVVPLLTVALVVCGGVSMLTAQESPPKESPAQQAPAKDAPAQEVQQAPAQEAPAPAPEPPAKETPAQEAPTQEAPSQQPAVQDAPAQRPPVKEAVAYERVPRKAKLFIEGEETVDASNSKNKASYGNFTVAIAAALTKKKVPVIVVTDPERADFLVRHTSSAKEDSTGTKIAKMAIFGAFSGGFSKFDASIMVIDKASTGVVYSYNVKKGNFQSAAEAFAKHLNNHIEGSE